MPASAPSIVYLDMNIWVSMARARRQPDQRWEQVFRGLAAAVARKRAVVALSAGNDLELWHRRDQVSREQVGGLMRDLSGYATMQALHLVRRREVHSHLRASSAGAHAQ